MSSYYFDIDRDLSSSNFIFTSNKTNQEFEYFILYCGNKLCTQKNYSKNYLSFIESKIKKEVSYNNDFKRAKSFIYNDEVKLEKLNSKKYSASINKEVLKKSSYTLSNLINSANNFILKKNLGFSGIGTFKYFGNEARVKNLNENSDYIYEPLRDRIYDFSSLFIDADTVFQYETLIDEQFQFKGLRSVLELDDLILKNYNKELDEIRTHLEKENLSYPYSIDSYLYIENGKTQLWSLCEINYRKTMSYFAFTCARAFQFDIFGFYIKPQAFQVNTSDVVVKLDPGDTRFSTYLVRANSKEDLIDIEKKLGL